jgi:hypothetical protein
VFRIRWAGYGAQDLALGPGDKSGGATDHVPASNSRRLFRSFFIGMQQSGARRSSCLSASATTAYHGAVRPGSVRPTCHGPPHQPGTRVPGQCGTKGSMIAESPRPLVAGDAGHLLGDDEPLVVIAALDTGQLNVIDDTGCIFPTWVPCFVRETDSLDAARLQFSIRYSRLLVFL